MKKIFVTCFVLCSFWSVGQTSTFEIKSVGNEIASDELKNAMNDANFDAFRLYNDRRTLKFKSGAIVELKSVTELVLAGIKVDRENYLKDGVPKGYIEPIYALINGNIVASYSTQNAK